MNKLYPLKFEPIYKEKIWGGNKLKTILNKNYGNMKNCGESWEISGVQDNISVVKNGFLKGNNLQEVIEIYMGDLVGDQIYEKFGLEFPLLLKFIDANDVLSIQVHPDDELALKRHNAYGKTEMWYVIQSDDGSELISGFKVDVDKNKYVQNLNNNTLKNLLNIEKVSKGDVFFIPAGRVHAIGSGILLAEIQQTSDITYRIYDWSRKDSNGNARELHTDLALDAIDFKVYKNYKTSYNESINQSNELVDCNYFTTNKLKINQVKSIDYNDIDSFVIYMCLNGKVKLKYNENADPIMVDKGETILCPAIYKSVELIPEIDTEILEIYIK